MVARKVWLPALGSWTLENSGDPFDPTTGRMAFSRGGPESNPPTPGEQAVVEEPKLESKELGAFLECASLCNIASVFQEPAKLHHDHPGAEKGGKVWAARGDPTEM